MCKVVSFNDTPVYHEMLSPDEYDRSQVKTVLYKRGYNRITNSVWQLIYKNLDFYKQREMPIHIDNINSFKL
jgi:hypothetical protein